MEFLSWLPALVLWVPTLIRFWVDMVRVKVEVEELSLSASGVGNHGSPIAVPVLVLK